MAKRTRCSNFTVSEVDILVELVSQHKDIIECKLTDHVSNNEKIKVWKMIELDFNAQSGTDRSEKMLRSKWDSLKKSTRRDYQNFSRKYFYETNGESFSDIKLNSIAFKILDIMGVSGINTPTFDADFNGKIEDIICEDTTIAYSSESMHSECKWSPILLRKPPSQHVIIPDITAIRENNEEEISPNISPYSETPSTSGIAKSPSPEESRSLTWKRKTLQRRKLQERKQNIENMETLLLKKRIKLVDLQTKLLQEEHEENKKRIIEKEKRDIDKHNLEMEILKTQLLNLKKQ